MMECVCAQAAEEEEVSKRLELVRAVPKGQKKDYSAEMLKGYHPVIVESATYASSRNMHHMQAKHLCSMHSRDWLGGCTHLSSLCPGSKHRI